MQASVGMNLRAVIIIGEDDKGEPQVLSLGNTSSIAGLLGGATAPRQVAIEAPKQPVVVQKAPVAAPVAKTQPVNPGIAELRAKAKALHIRGAHFFKDKKKLIEAIAAKEGTPTTTVEQLPPAQPAFNKGTQPALTKVPVSHCRAIKRTDGTVVYAFEMTPDQNGYKAVEPLATQSEPGYVKGVVVVVNREQIAEYVT